MFKSQTPTWSVKNVVSPITCALQQPTVGDNLREFCQTFLLQVPNPAHPWGCKSWGPDTYIFTQLTRFV